MFSVSITLNACQYKYIWVEINLIKGKILCNSRGGDKKVPLFKKRRLLVQKGKGVLSILIPAAVSVFSTLINGVRS